MSRINTSTLVALWVVVVVEMLSPFPGVLTIGAAWVLVARPRWFFDLVLRLYGVGRPR